MNEQSLKNHPQTDPSSFRSPHTLGHKMARVAWMLVYYLLFRPTLPQFGAWRNLLLRCFGAKLGRAWLHPAVKIFVPWKLQIGDDSYIAAGVDLYNDYGISIGNRVIVSQRTFLCSSGHDYTDPKFGLVGGTIVIEDDVWIAAEAFVSPGVRVGQGAVVGARAVVTRDVPLWTVVAGNPAKAIKQRNMRQPAPADQALRVNA